MEEYPYNQDEHNESQSSTILKQVNKLLKHSHQNTITSLTSLTLTQINRIIRRLFIVLPDRDEHSQNFTPSSLFTKLYTLLCKRYPRTFELDALELLLKIGTNTSTTNGTVTIARFISALAHQLGERIRRKLHPSDPRRVHHALEELGVLLRTLGIQIPQGILFSPEAIPPKLWLVILVSLFSVPRRRQLFLMFAVHPEDAVQRVIDVLQHQILNRRIPHVTGERLIACEAEAVVLFSELLCALGQVILLQPFDPIRRLSWSNRDISLSSKLDPDAVSSFAPSVARSEVEIESQFQPQSKTQFNYPSYGMSTQRLTKTELISSLPKPNAAIPAAFMGYQNGFATKRKDLQKLRRDHLGRKLGSDFVSNPVSSVYKTEHHQNDLHDNSENHIVYPEELLPSEGDDNLTLRLKEGKRQMFKDNWKRMG